MTKKNLKKVFKELTADRNNYMSSFRHNVDLYVSDKNITLSDISEAADIPFSTLRTFLYGNSTDCKLSTAVKLAKALGVSIDELIGAETIEPVVRESMAICRTLPEHSVYLVRYFIRHQQKIYEGKDNTIKRISVLKPQCNNGSLFTTNVVEPMEIDGLPDEIKAKAYLGIEIPCEHYMPYYAPGDIILVAADRDVLNGERCIITHNGNIYIVKKRSYIQNGKKKFKYLALMNDDFVVPEDIVDDKIGYIVGFLNPDGSLGIR